MTDVITAVMTMQMDTVMAPAQLSVRQPHAVDAAADITDVTADNRKLKTK